MQDVSRLANFTCVHQQLRVIRLDALVLVTSTLAACATAPRPHADACIDFAHEDGVFDGMAKLYRDPKGVHLLVVSRTLDGHGGLVVDSQVWPLSGPQEPAPPHMARVVLDACTMKLRRAVKLSD